MRRAGGDEHAAAGERVAAGGGCGAGEPGLDGGEDVGDFREPSLARLAALGHLADAGADEGHAVGAELRRVAAGGGMAPHARVHRRGDQHGLVGGEQHGGGEVVGMPAGHLGHEVGGGRGDDDQIGIAGQADVADLALVVEAEEVGEHPLVGQRADRQRRHELLAASVMTTRTRAPRSRRRRIRSRHL